MDGIMLFSAWQALARTTLKESLPRAITWVIKGVNFYGETI
jgi:hypothetical protein